MIPTTPTGHQRTRAVGMSNRRCHRGPIFWSRSTALPCLIVQRSPSSVENHFARQRLDAGLADLIANQVGPAVAHRG